jgi:hypothetical protein
VDLVLVAEPGFLAVYCQGVAAGSDAALHEVRISAQAPVAARTPTKAMPTRIDRIRRCIVELLLGKGRYRGHSSLHRIYTQCAIRSVAGITPHAQPHPSHRALLLCVSACSSAASLALHTW